MQKSTTKNPQETQMLGTEFAQKILCGKKQKSAVVLALRGDLGAGKTTFLQGFAKGLGIKEIVNSPTFVIMKKFKIVRSPTSHNFKCFYHIDCYRLDDAQEILQLGFEEIIENPENIVAIEWAEKISNMLPENTVSLTFKHLQKDTRKIDVVF